MTTAVSTTSPILKNIIMGNTNPTPTQAPKQTVSQDTFIKNENKKDITPIIASTISAIGGIGAVALFLNGFPKMVSKLKNTDTNVNKKGIEAFWEDISSALQLKDLKLSKKTHTQFTDFVNSIRDPKAFSEKGGDMINSILLYGPAGTGKTTLAKALAAEFPDSYFANLDVTGLSSSYVGETERNIQATINKICDAARMHKDKKFFVFIDEIDSIMLEDNGSSQKYSNDVISEFKRCLTEKLQKEDNIVTIGATNIPIDPEAGVTYTGKKLDKHMLDRFQQKILIDLPTEGQIRDFMVAHYKEKRRVADELKDASSEKLNIICKFLSNKKRETSFRTLKSIFNQAATISDKNTSTSIEDVFETISRKQKELHISDDELKELQKQLNIK